MVELSSCVVRQWRADACVRVLGVDVCHMRIELEKKIERRSMFGRGGCAGNAAVISSHPKIVTAGSRCCCRVAGAALPKLSAILVRGSRGCVPPGTGPHLSDPCIHPPHCRNHGKEGPRSDQGASEPNCRTGHRGIEHGAHRCRGNMCAGGMWGWRVCVRCSWW